MNKKFKIALSSIILCSTVATAFVDIEQELYAPIEEMKMLDRAMERGMDGHNQKVQPIEIIIDEGTVMDNSEMISFQEMKLSYELIKNIDNPKNTKVKITREGSTVKIEEKMEELIVLPKAGESTSSTSSSTVQIIPIPFDADASQLSHTYKDGLLTITVPKKVK